jgi:hypothetical protein
MPVSCGRGDFAENHLIAADEQLHAEQAIAAQRQHHFAGDLLRTLQRQALICCGCQDSR